MIRILSFILACSLSIALSHPLSAEKTCKYSYNPQDTKLTWTAYKFTEKVGVGGTFDKIIVKGDKKKEQNITQTMANAQFKILTNTVNSGVEDRDKKIKKYFFGSAKNQKPITGFFQNTSSGNKGTSTLVLTFNGITKNIPVEFQIEGSTLTAQGKLDAADFGMMPGINKLNEVCKDLHIGKDGVSKLWSEVDFKITSNFTINCE